MEQSVCQKILILLWVWWSARKKANRGEKMAYEANIYSSVMYHLKVCEKLQDQQKPASEHLKVSWIPPPEEFYKLMFMPPSMSMMAMAAGVLLFVTMKELCCRPAHEVSEEFLVPYMLKR
jgi:hypothetical protein